MGSPTFTGVVQGVSILAKSVNHSTYIVTRGVLFTNHLKKHYQTWELYFSLVFQYSISVWLQKSTLMATTRMYAYALCQNSLGVWRTLYHGVYPHGSAIS